MTFPAQRSASGRRSRPEIADDDLAWSEAPRRRGILARLFGPVKLGLVLAPLGIVLYGAFVADCRARTESGIGQILRAGACARHEILGNAVAAGDGLTFIRRVIE